MVVAELDYALLADFAVVTADGCLTAVGAHRSTFHVVGVPTQHVVCVGGRVFLGRREPAATLSLGALTPDGEVPEVARWAVEPRTGSSAAGLEGGRVPVCFAVTLVAPVPRVGAYALVLSVNGEVLRRLPFDVVDTAAAG